MYSIDHNKILHMSRQCYCRDVQNFIAIDLICHEQEHNKISLNFKFDRNIIRGTGAWPESEGVRPSAAMA